jgi:hypothetical protein
MNDSITFASLKWGVKYSANYVNISFDMIRRNLPPTTAFRFACFTDDAAGLLSGIGGRPLPLGLT